MEFEYDPNKSASNTIKHGIDFEEAQELWQDADRLEIPAHFRGEERFAVIGRIPERMWTAVYTMRGNTIRLISCRRSRNDEVALYEYEKRK